MKYLIVSSACSGASSISKVLFNLTKQWYGCRNYIGAITKHDPEFPNVIHGFGFAYINGTIYESSPGDKGHIIRKLMASPNHLFMYTHGDKDIYHVIRGMCEYFGYVPVIIKRRDVLQNYFQFMKKLCRSPVPGKYIWNKESSNLAINALTNFNLTNYNYDDAKVIYYEDVVSKGMSEETLIDMLGMERKEYTPIDVEVWEDLDESMFANLPDWSKNKDTVTKKLLDFDINGAIL